MSNSTFPPTSSSTSGGPAAREVRLFVPDLAGNPPAGWTWLDGLASSGYDQGSDPNDSLLRTDMSTVAAISPRDDDFGTVRLMSQDQTTQTIYNSTTGLFWGLSMSTTDGSFVGATAQSYAHSLAVQPTVVSSNTGYTPPVNISTVNAVGLLASSSAEVRFWVSVQTADGASHVLLEGTTGWTDVVVPFPVLYGSLVAPGQLLLTGLALPDFTGEAILLNLADNSQSALTDSTAAANILCSNSMSNVAVILASDNVSKEAATVSVVAGVVTLTAFSGALPSNYPYDWIVANDGTPWRLDESSVWRVTTTGTVAQVAGRHPLLAGIGRCLLLPYNAPSDWLTEPMGAWAFEFGSLVGNSYYLAAQDPMSFNLGGMLSSFQRKAMFTGS